MLTCGLDIGARSIDIVLLEGGRIVASSVTETGISPRENALRALAALLTKSGLEPLQIARTVATGYGRNAIESANRVASEILCHAAGTSRLFPQARTVIDIGAQDSKIIRLGDGGMVLDFIMNDRCAAGTGKFIEMAAAMLHLSLEEAAESALQTEEAAEISSMCAVFAESEIIGLLHKGIPRAVILRGIFRSIARRTLGMAGRFGLEKDIVFTGGVALNQGIVEVLKREARIREILIPPVPQITGALGAAIFAERDLAGR